MGIGIRPKISIPEMITEKLMKKWGFERPVRGMKVTSIGRHHYHVESETRPEIKHVVDLEGEFPACSCENATLGGNILGCKHIRRVGLLKDAGLLPKDESVYNGRDK